MRSGRWPAISLAALAIGGALLWWLGWASGTFSRRAPALALNWATTEFVAADSGEGTVELKVIVDNNSGRATESTSILWEPAFAAAATFVRSEPPGWRVRIDGRGWGVLDTAGILPGRSGSFRLWFRAPGTGRTVPRIVVVANGKIVIADTVADVRIPVVAGTGSQGLFVRGPLAAMANGVTFVPVDPRAALPLATAVAVLLGLLATAGGLAALRVTNQRPPAR